MEIISDKEFEDRILEIVGVNDEGKFVRETVIVPGDGTVVTTKYNYISIGFPKDYNKEEVDK